MLVESFSGIRGIYGESLTEEIAEKYTYLYFSYLKKKYKEPKIVIGTDTRPSSEILKNVLIESLNIDIIDVGVAPTPAVEFAVRHFKANGGIIITASHNEPYWNGFKFLNKDGSILNDKDMNSIIELYQKNKKLPLQDFAKKFLPKKKGKLKIGKIIKKHEELIRVYTNFLLSFIKKDLIKIKNANLKVVIDPNGGTGIIAKEILEEVGVEVIGMNMDFSIFNRKVEPTEGSLVYMGNVIRENKADFGAGFDCDADRIQIMLPDNSLVSGHYLLALIANEMFKDGKKKVIVTNDATSCIVKEVANKHKAKLVEVEVGETNVLQSMGENKAIVGGEGSSGGIIVAPSTSRDGILTLLLVIKIVSLKKAALKDIIDDYPCYFTQTKKLQFDPKNYQKIKKNIEQHFKSDNKKIRKTGDETGGLKVIVDEKSFIWYRASKTEPNVIRIMADSNSKEKTEKLLLDAIETFKKVK